MHGVVASIGAGASVSARRADRPPRRPDSGSGPPAHRWHSRPACPSEKLYQEQMTGREMPPTGFELRRSRSRASTRRVTVTTSARPSGRSLGAGPRGRFVAAIDLQIVLSVRGPSGGLRVEDAKPFFVGCPARIVAFEVGRMAQNATLRKLAFDAALRIAKPVGAGNRWRSRSTS
jgi:hypothetical protein